MLANKKYSDDITILISSLSFNSINIIKEILPPLFRKSNYNLSLISQTYSQKEYELYNIKIRISSNKIAAYLNRIDIFIPLDNESFYFFEKELTPTTLIIANEKLGFKDKIDIPLPIKIDNSKENIEVTECFDVMTALYALFDLDYECLIAFLKKYSIKIKKDLELNHIDNIYQNVNKIIKDKNITTTIKSDETVKNEYFLSGIEAIISGALIGGCDFFISHHRADNKPIIKFINYYKDSLPIIIESALDELSAINEAIGASYSGSRVLLSTTVDGFCQMFNKINVAGLLEIPLVIHISGKNPASPTANTDQSFLNIMLYFKQYDFPVAIFYPGTVFMAIEAMYRCFLLAYKYHIPSIIFTDRYFEDSVTFSPKIDFLSFTTNKYIQETDSSYLRYTKTEDGFSPRGIPGYGKGIVSVNKKELFEANLYDITDFNRFFEDKIARKSENMVLDVMPARFVGPDIYDKLIISTGSNYYGLREALIRLNWMSTSLLHITQIFPLHPMVDSFMIKAKKIYTVENNCDSHFKNYLTSFTKYKIHETINKASNMPFYVEELMDLIRKM